MLVLYKEKANKMHIWIIIIIILFIITETTVLLHYKFHKDKFHKDIQVNYIGEEIHLNNTIKIPIFTFHRIVPDDIKKEQFEDNEWAESINVFEEQMKYLYDNGYKTISLDQFYCWYKGNCVFDKKTVVITFDDGNADDYYLVMPILRKYNFKATTFIVGSRTYETGETEYNPNKRTFITKEIINKTKQIYPELEYQSHTWNLHVVEENGKEKVLNSTKEELLEDFKNNSEFHFKYIAYPFGVYTEEMIEATKESGYLLAFTFRNHDYATRKSPQYEIPRIKINGFSSVEDIKNWLNY
jgi:peptidoglycan/xylan/chitin deacetylase (PgdA/CDA1 family)